MPNHALKYLYMCNNKKRCYSNCNTIIAILFKRFSTLGHVFYTDVFFAPSAKLVCVVYDVC